MTTDRTTLRLNDKRKRLLNQAKEIVVADPSDDPPMSDVIDAALIHLVKSRGNLEEVRTQYPPQEVKDFCNTSALRLRYRTNIDSSWR
jgi:hypothetical protein